MEKKVRKNKRRLLIPLIIVLILVVSCIIYIQDYYHADASASEVINNPPAGVTVEAGKTVSFSRPKTQKPALSSIPAEKWPMKPTRR